jgi:glycosyltransferase involved in cell wall biosynthesis
MKDRGIELVVCGRQGRASLELFEAVDRVGKYGRSIVLRSDVSDTELDQLHSGCWAYVQPSLYEGLGIPLIESLSAGIPSISADAGNGGYILKAHPDLLFRGENVGDIREHLSSAVGDDRFRKMACEVGPQVAHTTDWVEVARAIHSEIVA